MRDILYRGKCQNGYDYSNGDGWVYGSLLQKDESAAIVKTKDIDFAPKTDDGFTFINDFGCIPVDSNSVGQFTGLTDKNGAKIFDGDICRHSDSGNYPRPLVVEWVDEFACFAFVDKGDFNKKYYFAKGDMNNIEVVGIIHDNKDLLK